MSEQRIPPHSVEAEQMVIGAVLCDNDAINRLGGVVQTEHFYVPAHRRIFAAMCGLVAQRAPIDVSTLVAYLRQTGELEAVGGVAALARLDGVTCTAASIEYHAGIVRDQAYLRQAIYAMQEKVVEAYAQPDDVGAFLLETRQAVTEATAATIHRGPRLIMDGMQQAIMEAMSGKAPEGVLPTGFKAFDRLYGGLWSGLVQVVAGRPSSGKSVMALNLALNVARAGNSVLYISLEDVFKTAQRRVLARLSSVNLTKILLNQAYGAASERLIDVIKHGQDVPLWVEDRPHSALEICQLAAQWRRNHGLQLLIVDHLGYVKTEQEEYKANSGTMRVLCDLAKELDIPILLLVQLNRQCELRSKMGVPMMSDLRGSGRIEEDARGIMFVHRPYQYDEENEDPRAMRLLVKKWTNGPVGTVTLAAMLEVMTVTDFAEEEYPGGEDAAEY